MPRLFLTLLLACGVLPASASVFSSCTDGITTLSPCSNDPNLISGGISGPGYSVNAYAGVSAFATDSSLLPPTFPNIPDGQKLQAIAETVAVFNPGPTSSVPTAAQAHASETLTFTSGGPVHLGSIELEVLLGYIHEDTQGSASVTLTDGTHTYSYSGGGGIFGSTPPTSCNPEDCEYTATVPFDLGVPFQVSVSANSQLVASELEGGHDGGATVLFGLFDVNGAPVPSIPTPEPATASLLALSAVAGVVLYRRRCLTEGSPQSLCEALPVRCLSDNGQRTRLSESEPELPSY
jgi:hypothetical protein